MTSQPSLLPRGFSKKRKPPDTIFFILFLIISTPLVDAFTEPLIDFATTTTELPTAVGKSKDGICRDIFIRYEIEKIHALNGCRVVEGSVAIMLMDEIKEHEIKDISFPDLVEITGYLMVYRISGLKTLSNLFPNLAVIRGSYLFKDYSLIIYEMMELTDIGLKSLVKIERGNVRIEKNEKLCFVDTIDWKKITSASTNDPYLEKNQPAFACPNCPTDKCQRENKCWNTENCQRNCKCGSDGSCMPSGKCCSKNCLGGCEEGYPDKCVACRKYSVGVYPEIKCIESCPNGTYLYHNRRCLSKTECYDLNTHIATDSSVASPEGYFFPFQTQCHFECPPRYSKVGRGNETKCEPCKNKCQKRCPSRIIDSIASAQKLKGCSIIDGHLEIQIRGSTKNLDSNNIVKELQQNLMDIEVIEEYLKIARSHPILSLSFLKNLKAINGKKLESNRNALIVWENQNLQELWDENQTVAIGGQGKLFFHFNPKLCFNKIENLAKKIAPHGSNYKDIIENYDTAKLSNGDKTPCDVEPLPVTVDNTFAYAALLSWSPLKLGDERSLLNYVVYYIAAPHQNVTLWDGRNACGNDDWNVEDVNIPNKPEKISQPITKLEPYTQYAFYVKAFTLASEQKGAQSDIGYFKTKPAQPARMKTPKLIALGPHQIKVTWEAPKKANGEIDHYILRAKALDQKSFSQRNYCDEESRAISAQRPSTQPKDSPSPPSSPKEPKVIDGVAPDGFCDCKTCGKFCSGEQVKPPEDEEDRRYANEFEDEIQDFVYIQNPDILNDDMSKDSNIRSKRQTEFPDDVKTIVIPSDRDNLKNSSDFYNDQIPMNVTSFIITNLTHFRTYSISIRVCRKPEGDEQPLADSLCSYDASDHQQTFMEPSKDNIKDFRAVKESNNSSSHDIRVSWTPPESPNGFLLSYQILYKRVESDTHNTHICVPGDRSFYIIPKVPPGNYTIEMRASSLAQDGNYTTVTSVIIDEPSNRTTLYIIFGLIITLLTIVAVFAFFLKRLHLSNISSMKLIANVNPDYAGVTYKQDEWEIPREKILQLQELGQGSFGMVYEGIIKDNGRPGEERCAIKTVNESATDKERISFLNEASVMKQFDTHHVVRLLGVVSQGQPAFVVMELMANGDLKGYLRSHRPEYDTGTESPKPPTLRQILQMSIEIADGMSYLSAKKFVHRDLAARNCMVAEDMTVKIGDFGMTRDIYETDYYRKGTKGLLPVRWMSPESLKDGIFSSYSDVFSFGVVLWEMATLASQPYQGLSNDQVLRYVIEGGVMERPENCPDKLYELMRRCWQHRPSARPSFMEIITLLLEDVGPKFQKVSFYHSLQGQETLHQLMQGELAVQINDDVTTPLRQDEEENSSVEVGNNFLMGEYRNAGDL